MGYSILNNGQPRNQRNQRDYYPTPRAFCDAALALVEITPQRILDVGVGRGVWGAAARSRWSAAHIEGVEARDVTPHPAYDVWHRGDYLHHPLSGEFDLIMGNPPYNIAESAVRRSLGLRGAGGEVLFLLRLAFLESQSRYRGLWEEHPPSRVIVSASRISFTGDGKSDATAYALYGWQGHTRSSTSAGVCLWWFDWKA